MKKIKLLPENLINQIAAGEVIERPASIVKELVENSIDAGASKIEIEIANNCRNIRVSDNGHGIDKDDAALAFSRHATSKIAEEKDLWSISSLGFRGEALASIISVSKVECSTRTSGSNTGIRVECENSNIKITEIGCAIGTTMEVKDLFYNVPARMKFLKKPQTELASIVESIQAIAISHPEVALTLINRGSATLKTSGSSDLSVTISEIYSKELINEVVEVYKEDKESNIKVKGFTSNPSFTRSNKRAIYTFVNGRTVKCPILLKAIDTAYKDLIPSGKYPFVVLNLNISNKEIDVNVHPAKREVRYTNSNQVFNFIHSSIKLALEDGFGAYQVPNNNEEEIPLFAESSEQTQPNNYARQEYSDPVASPIGIDFKQMKEQISKSQDFYAPVQAKMDLNLEESVKQINKPKIVGQYFNTYILIEAENTLLIVDQHIAHERAIYEKLKTDKTFASQLILMSTPVRLELSQVSLLDENKEILSKFGYEFEIIDDYNVKLKQVPQIATNCVHEKIIGEIIEALESDLEHIENKILITTACHAAIKAGEKLSIWQMEKLITEWQNSNFSMTCPHGRKICHTISLKEIASFFGRFE